MIVERIGIIEEVAVLRLEVRMLREEVVTLWRLERRRIEEQEIEQEKELDQEMVIRGRYKRYTSYCLVPTPFTQAEAISQTELPASTEGASHTASFLQPKIDQEKNKSTCVNPLPNTPKSSAKPNEFKNIVAQKKTQLLMQVKMSSRVQCDHCDKSYTTENRLMKHIKSVHKDILLDTVNMVYSTSDSSSNKKEILKNFHCPLCDWKGATAGVVKTHVKKKHM